MVNHPDSLAAWNRANRRARIAYLLQPTTCSDWCVHCVRPRGSNRKCDWRRDVARMRKERAEGRAS